MTLILRGIAVFFLLIVGTSVMMTIFKTEFGTINYWDKHGVFFLIFITFFPRLTLLVSSVPFGGFFWWLGFIFLPRVLVASLATVAYFHTNPFLVTMSWLLALGGEVFEKWGMTSRKRFIFKTYQPGNVYENEPSRERTLNSGDVIEAEFTKKDYGP
jgi:hypothetical protein